MQEHKEDATHNLLTESVIRLQWQDGNIESKSLPGVLASLSGKKEIVAGFPGLQPHQWPAWHSFLVQLSALAVTNDDDLPADEDAWRECLRRLTSHFEEDEPWRLVVRDLDLPAFMQPPVPENTLKGFKGPHRAPDSTDLDILFTADHHELKMDRQSSALPEHWIYGLICYQTLSGYAGKGNYGIIRMNAGTATRVLVGLAPAQDWNSCFLRDLSVLREKHDHLAQAHRLARNDGFKLLWIHPWDGKTSIPWADCDPYAIEVSRRVRLLKQTQGLLAYHRSTEVPRLSPKSDVLKGNVGDPWIPISEDGKAVNVGSAGWHYDRTRQILFSDGYTWSPCQEPREDDPEELWFYAVALARGQGKTQGFHERWIHVPRKIRRRLFNVESRHSLSKIAQERVAKAGKVRKALHMALIVLLAGAPEQNPNFQDQSDQRWLRLFDSRVDTEFFPRLWADADLEREEQNKRWDNFLQYLAEEVVLSSAQREAPIADARKERATAISWMSLRGQLNKILTASRD
jgi:CRISPR system Cascade subunit CasA